MLEPKDVDKLLSNDTPKKIIFFCYNKCYKRKRKPSKKKKYPHNHLYRIPIVFFFSCKYVK